MLEKMMQSGHSPNLMNEMNKTLLGLQTKMETITKDITKRYPKPLHSKMSLRTFMTHIQRILATI